MHLCIHDNVTLSSLLSTLRPPHQSRARLYIIYSASPERLARAVAAAGFADTDP